MRKPKRKLVVAAALAVVVLAALSVAVAEWTVTGSGSGNAKALGQPETVTVTASTGPADLYPGFTQGDVYFTLSNTNPYGVDFTSFTSGTVTSSDPTNCPAANVTVADGNIVPTVHVNGNEAPSAQKSIPDVVTLASNAPDGCQNVTFTIALTLSGVST